MKAGLQDGFFNSLLSYISETSETFFPKLMALPLMVPLPNFFKTWNPRMKKHYLAGGVFQVCLLLLLGCGGSSEPQVAGPDTNAEKEEISKSAEKDSDSSPEISTDTDDPVEPVAEVAKVPDRYSQPTIPTETNPWKGPRPEVPVRSFSKEQFLASWQIDLDVTDKPLQDVIQQITSGVEGWNPQIVLAKKSSEFTDPLEPEILQQSVSLQLSKVSRLEAIEKACEAVGAYPQYGHERELESSTKSLITLHPGPRIKKFQAEAADPPATLVQFAGPIMIEVTKIQQFPPYGTGSIELRMNSLPLPAPVRNLLSVPATTIQSVTVPGGENVMTGQGDSAHVILPTELDVRLETLHLKHLLKDVMHLESIAGQLSLPIPNSTSIVWIDSLVEGTVVYNDQVTAKLETNSTSPGSWYLRYSVVSDRALAGLAAFAYDEAGKLIKTDGFGTSWAPNFNQGSGSLNLSHEPRMLAVVVVNKQSTYEQEFSLDNIPLDKHEDQPEALPELAHGDAPQPVSVIVGELRKDNIFKQVNLRLVNHSNKDIREVDVLLHYLDSAGQTLRDNPTVISAKLSDASQPYPILIPAEKTADVLQTAFFCPDETTQVRVSIESVTFADLDRWEADQQQ